MLVKIVPGLWVGHAKINEVSVDSPRFSPFLNPGASIGVVVQMDGGMGLTSIRIPCDTEEQAIAEADRIGREVNRARQEG